MDARWQIAQPLAFTTGVGLGSVEPEQGASRCPQTNTFSAKAALDWTPADWALIRATYAPSFRRGNKLLHELPRAGRGELAEPGELGQSLPAAQVQRGRSEPAVGEPDAPVHAPRQR